MKKVMGIFLLLIMIMMCMAAYGDNTEIAIERLKEHCYYNPAGGTKLHTDPNCRTVHEKYLPLQEIEFSEELLDQYSLCWTCTLTDAEQEDLQSWQDFVFEISETELNAKTAEWETTYGNHKLWNYEVNAAFVNAVGTEPEVPYVFDRSILSVLPDDDAITAEKISEQASSLAASYGSRLTEDILKGYQVIVTNYRKPDRDNYLFSITGSWIVGFFDEENVVAWMYVDAHTGIPNFLSIVPDNMMYNGAPGVEGEMLEG